MKTYKKILVVCPAGAVTGGPEALHQLVDHMQKLGLPAYIVYLPFDREAQAPAPYQHYVTPTHRYEDEVGNLIIFPEVYPMMAKKVKKADAALWWLSLENFLERRHVSKIRDKLRYWKRVIKGARPMRGAKDLKGLLHFSQTEHSTQYLRSCGIEPIPLIDSINEGFLTDQYIREIAHKKDIVLYNPTKGAKVTQALIKAYPQYQFVPLRGLNRDQLTEHFYGAKVYIDFGHHPGRDRMPREAAMHGCCLISGLLGSAGNDVDLPIPKKYKLNSDADDFISRFGELVGDIFQNFPMHFQEFDAYRKWLQNEPRVFRQQIADYFIQ